jgi:hypothetical protein
MKSLAFFLSMALVISALSEGAFAHDGIGFNETHESQESAVLGEFAEDIQAGAVVGLKDLAIRASSDSRLELRVAEQIMAHSSTRVIHCLACREKNTDLKRIAKLSNIEHFMEVQYQGTPEHQELSLRITRVKDGKEVWKKTYIHDDEEMRETSVEVVREPVITAFASGMILPKEVIGSMGAFGLGARIQRKGWGLEVNAFRSTEKDTLFHLLALKSWKMKTRADEFWVGTGAVFLTGNTRTAWTWVIRAGYDWHFSRQWIAGIFAGDRPVSPYSGLEAGVRIGFIF